jgi:hypothetical protein
VLTAGPAATAGKARKSQQRLLALQAAAEAAEAAKILDPLPPPVGWTEKWGRFRSGLWGPCEPGVPLHRVSMMRAGGLNPVLASGGTGLDSPAWGITDKGTLFRYDPWDAYAAQLVTSTGMMVLGTMGGGKSYLCKVFALALMAIGRRVIVLEDPKSEWTPVADWLNMGPDRPADVIKLGPSTGNRLNPLDAGVRDWTMSEELWLQQVQAARLAKLLTIVSILRSAQPFTAAEENTVTEALQRECVAHPATPTIRGVWDQLDLMRSASVRAQDPLIGEAAEQLWLTFRLLTAGPTAGMFDLPSTVRLDPAAALTVLDTAALAGSQPRVKAIASECTTGWVTATLRSRDGAWRLLIAEEAWEALSDPYRVAGMDEMLRLSGHWRCALMLVTHQLSDATRYADLGSAHRGMMEGLFSLLQTQIIFASSETEASTIATQLGLTDQERRIIVGELQQGWALWRIGSQLRVKAKAYATPHARMVADTSIDRAG